MLGLISCGGGGGGSDSTSASSSSDVLVGKFVDAPTAGVSYTCGTQSGKTDSNGNFNYQSGQSCTFKVGNVSIGSMDTVPTDKIVTPYDLAGVSRNSKIDPHAIGIAQFLQSIDDGSSSGSLTINTSTLTKLSSVSSQNLATDRTKVKSTSLTQLITDGGASSLIARSTAAQNMETYLTSINISRSIKVTNSKLPEPSSSSKFQFVYKYGWQNTDQSGADTGSASNPTYYLDGCRSYNGTCTKTNNYEYISDSGYTYRAYPLNPTTSFTAKYLGLGIGGGIPDFVKIYDSQTISWSNSYTPSSGQGPNALLATSTSFDIFFTGSKEDVSGNTYTRHPGSNDKTPGFQAYLGSSGVSIQANQIYWIVVKYTDTGVRYEKCLDFIGTNQYTLPSAFSSDTLLYYGSSLGNGYAYFLMSTDGTNWEPADMLSGGVCNSFLAN